MHKLYDFIEARERLTTVVVKTKLIHSPVFSEESGNEIYLKPENLQKTGSFKIRGASIGHVSPEDAAGGTIAIVQDGDIIEIDIPNRKINVKLSDEEIARRKAELKPYEPNVKGYLKRYAAHVSSAASGAIYVE